MDPLKDVYPKMFKDAIRLETKGLDCQSLDVIYRTIDNEMLAGRFYELDMFLRVLIELTADLSIDHMLGYLTITKAAADHLPGRINFFSKVKEELQSRGEDAETILTGLGH